MKLFPCVGATSNFQDLETEDDMTRSFTQELRSFATSSLKKKDCKKLECMKLLEVI